MKKNHLMSVIFVSSTLLAIEIITSCSTDFEEDVFFGNYTLQEKSEIKRIAKEYGFNVEIDESYFGQKMSKQDQYPLI